MEVDPRNSPGVMYVTLFVPMYLNEEYMYVHMCAHVNDKGNQIKLFDLIIALAEVNTAL